MPYPEGTKPTPNALFYDDFSVLFSALNTWEPDYNAFANADWIDNDSPLYSPRLWYGSGIDITDSWAAMGTVEPGAHGVGWFWNPGSEPIPPELAVPTVKYSFKVKFAQASADISGDGYMGWFRLGNLLSFIVYKDSGSASGVTMFFYGPMDMHTTGLTFDADTEYPCEITVSAALSVIDFLGLHVEMPMWNDSTNRAGPIGVELWSGLAFSELLVEEVEPPVPVNFWTGFRNTHEVL